MNDSIIIALLAIATFFLYKLAIKQKNKSRQVRKKMVDKAWRRDRFD